LAYDIEPERLHAGLSGSEAGAVVVDLDDRPARGARDADTHLSPWPSGTDGVADHVAQRPPEGEPVGVRPGLVGVQIDGRLSRQAGGRHHLSGDEIEPDGLWNGSRQVRAPGEGVLVRALELLEPTRLTEQLADPLPAVQTDVRCGVEQ